MRAFDYYYYFVWIDTYNTQITIIPRVQLSGDRYGDKYRKLQVLKTYVVPHTYRKYISLQNELKRIAENYKILKEILGILIT